MGDVTPEQRAVWRQDALDVREHFHPGATTEADRILALLDALDAAEARVAAAEREALERAREAIKAERLSISKQVQVVMGLVRAERIVRDLMPRKDGE